MKGRSRQGGRQEQPHRNLRQQKKKKRFLNKQLNRERPTCTNEGQCSCGQPLSNPTPDCYSHMTQGY
jgi:hypothetical protein